MEKVVKAGSSLAGQPLGCQVRMERGPGEHLQPGKALPPATDAASESEGGPVPRPNRAASMAHGRHCHQGVPSSVAGALKAHSDHHRSGMAPATVDFLASVGRTRSYKSRTQVRNCHFLGDLA